MDKENKKEFDFAQGGSQKLPDYLNIMKFAEFRAKEIKCMVNSLNQSSGTKLLFQQLPVHMRRRTMSHKVKRLPQKLREGHMNQLQKSGVPVKTKRPSRKFRRKPKNLLSEYNRRQRKYKWLETHIWHAKRFHMIEKWGYKLPLRSCDKTYRSNYRATSQHCLLQDISYYVCLELIGHQYVITEGLKLLTNKTCGLTLSAKAFINGQREGTLTLFNENKYPFGAIGEVKFIWKPSANLERVLWLWVHPAYHKEIMKNIISVFKLTKNSAIEQNTTYFSNTVKLSLKVYKDNFNRFRLTGPLSNAVIQNSLKPPKSNNKTLWFDQYLNQDDNRQIFYDQCNYFESLKNIQSPADISPYIILNLITTDPRYNFPNKRSKAVPNSSLNNARDICSNAKYGEIWNCNTRALVSKNKLSTAQFLKDRANRLVPEDEIPDNADAFPVMLIQRPGAKNTRNRLGYGCGWDIIVPSGWGLPMWLCFIMWGARVGGLRESKSIQYEMGKYDLLSPDTKAGEYEQTFSSNCRKDTYFRLPFNKRINYNKFAICSPFDFPWKQIIGEWNGTTVDEFFVLRDLKILVSLQEIISTKSINKKTLITEIDNFSENCLIPVRLTIINKGTALKNAIICLPKEKDLRKKSVLPVEPLHEDANEEQRKKLRKQHILFLAKMRKRRIRAYNKEKMLPQPIEQRQKFTQTMRNLWIPQPKTVKDSCSRSVIGFITKGNKSFSSGRSQSIGYICLKALKELFDKSQSDLVLVRNTISRQYRWANIEIICN